ncbi:hypothetical protein F5B17DRAFT_412732 [Nemania serpens]|nr:hypothetical protein F5B17DRAFT_412732 [Nemania serpens]
MKLTAGLQLTLRTTIAAITDGLKAHHPTKPFLQPTRNLTYSTNTTRRQRTFFQASQPSSSPIISRNRLYSTSTNSSSSPLPPTMAAPENNNSTSTTQPSAPSHPATPLPALPAAGDPSSLSSPTLEVGGSALRLDHLGPLVVNADGTLSRIANWEKMAEIERENTPSSHMKPCSALKSP